MREKVNAERIQLFMRALGSAAKQPLRVYLVGGATAVLLAWRDSTIDLDLKLVPDADSVLRLLPDLKEKLHLNVELASPDDFIPPLPGWQERSRYIQREGNIEFFHYDFYGQALAKIERGHGADRGDVRVMIESGLVRPDRLLELFGEIEPQLYRYPAVDPASFREAVEEVAEEFQTEPKNPTSTPGS